MPWSKDDVSRFKKGLTDKQKRAWVKVANDRLNSGDDEATAIKKANAAVDNVGVEKRAPGVKVRLNGKDHLGRPLWKATSLFGNALAPFPSGLETEGKPKIEEVAIADLRPTQPKLEAGTVNGYMADDSNDPIHVVAGDKGPRIMDGHHRAAAEALKGNATIKAHVWQPGKTGVKKSLDGDLVFRPAPPEKVAKRDRPKRPEVVEYELFMPIAKRDEDKRLVFGWMYLPTDNEGHIIVDKHEDFMLPEDLEETAYKYVDSSRAGGIMHLRESQVSKAEDNPYRVSTLVESMVFTPEKCEALGIAKNAVPNGAWWVGYRVQNDAVWDSVKNGTLQGFSVHGKARRVPVGKSETPVKQPEQEVAPHQPAQHNKPQRPEKLRQTQQGQHEQKPQQAGGEGGEDGGAQVTTTLGPNGKTTKKTKRRVRPQRPDAFNKALDVLANGDD